MFERYTPQARRVIFFARYEASTDGSAAIEAEHLLLGLMREDRPLFKRLLRPDTALDELRRRLERRDEQRPKIETSTELPLADNSKRALAFAHEESNRCGHQHIGTEHLLVGLLLAEETHAARVLSEGGLTREVARGYLAREPDARTSTEMSEPAEAVTSLRDASNRLDALLFSMTPARIEHIGIATHKLADALPFWRDALGLEVTHTEVVEEQGVRVAMLPAGEPRIELLEPTGEDSPVAKFLQKRGPGIHHVAVRVPDIRAALARLKENGARLIDQEPRVGAGNCLVAFVHPQTAGGVLLELVEHQRQDSDTESER